MKTVFLAFCLICVVRLPGFGAEGQECNVIAVEGFGITNLVELGMAVSDIETSLGITVERIQDVGENEPRGYIGQIPQYGVEFVSQSSKGKVDKIYLNVDASESSCQRFCGRLSSGLSFTNQNGYDHSDIVALYGDVPHVEAQNLIPFMRVGQNCAFCPKPGIELLYYVRKGIMFELRNNHLVRIMIERPALVRKESASSAFHE